MEDIEKFVEEVKKSNNARSLDSDINKLKCDNAVLKVVVAAEAILIGIFIIISCYFIRKIR